MPNLDWARTEIFQKILKNQYNFNSQSDMTVYTEAELDYIIMMLNTKMKDFKLSDMTKPFHTKGMYTLERLLDEQGLSGAFYSSLYAKYKEVTVENTIKILIRCKMLFASRVMIIHTLNQLISYEVLSVDFKQHIQKHTKMKVSQQEYEKIMDKGNKVYSQGTHIVKEIKRL